MLATRKDSPAIAALARLAITGAGRIASRHQADAEMIPPTTARTPHVRLFVPRLSPFTRWWRAAPSVAGELAEAILPWTRSTPVDMRPSTTTR